MATIANQFDPNDPNKTAGVGNGTPSTGGGAAPTGGGGAGAPASSATPYQPPNVSQYLAANQGAGQQLTQGITGNVQGQANQLNQGVNTAQSALNAKAEPLQQNLGASASGVINNVYNNATSYTDPSKLLADYNTAKAGQSAQNAPNNNYTRDPVTGAISGQGLPADFNAFQSQIPYGATAPGRLEAQGYTDQTAVAPNQSTLNQFNKLNTGGYNQDIASYGNYGRQQQNQLQNQLGNLTQQTGSAQNEMGRAQLLRNAIGQGNYNQGQQTLDTLFLQGQPGQVNAQGNSNLQQLQQNLGGIGKQATTNVQGLGADTQKRLAALQGLSAADQSSIKNLFTGGLNDIGTNVNNEYARAQAMAPVSQKYYQTNATSPNSFSSEDLAYIGGPAAGTHTYGINDISPYLKTNALTGNAQTATPEEFARYQALHQLAGTNLAPSAATNIFGSQQAPTAAYSPVGFDTTRFNTDVAAQKANLNGRDMTEAFGKLPTGAAAGLGPEYAAALASGKLTPDLINELIQNKISTQVSPLGADPAGQRRVLEAGWSPYENWYNQTYLPATQTTLGPAATPANTSPLNGPINVINPRINV